MYRGIPLKKECIFCKIVRGESPAQKIYETNDILAFLDINPVTDGHTLVIPKEHYRDIFQIPLPMLEKTMEATKKIAKKAQKTLNAGGVNILHNSGSVAQQAVPHFHIHIIPRYPKDQINIFPGRKGNQEEIDLIAKNLREQLKET